MSDSPLKIRGDLSFREKEHLCLEVSKLLREAYCYHIPCDLSAPWHSRVSGLIGYRCQYDLTLGEMSEGFYMCQALLDGLEKSGKSPLSSWKDSFKQVIELFCEGGTDE